MTKICVPFVVLAIALAGCTPYHSEYELSSRLVRNHEDSTAVTKAQLRKVQSDVRALSRQVSASSKRSKSGLSQAQSEQLNGLIADVQKLKAQASQDEPNTSSEQLAGLKARITQLEESEKNTRQQPGSAGAKPTEISSSLSAQVAELKQRLSTLETSHKALNTRQQTFEAELDEDASALIDQLVAINEQIENLEKLQRALDTKNSDIAASTQAAQKVLTERLSALQADILALRQAKPGQANPARP